MLPMKELASLLQKIGAERVQTYIQSGNAVFEYEGGESSELSAAISRGVKERFGFEPAVQLLGMQDLRDAISGNPFPEAESDPKTLHLGFLAATPKNPDLKALEALKKDSEGFRLTDRVFYLKAPEGVGRSKLAANSERLLGVPMTDRNWRTVCALMDMARRRDS